MNCEFRQGCQGDARRLVWVIGTVFALVLVVQYFELPYGSVISSLFYADQAQPIGMGAGNPKVSGNTSFNGLNISNVEVSWNTANITKSSEDSNIGLKNDFVSENNGGSNSSLGLSDNGDPEDERPTETFIDELSQNSTVEKTLKESGSVSEKVNEHANSFPPDKVGADNNSTLGSIKEESSNLTEEKNGTDSAPASGSFIEPIQNTTVEKTVKDKGLLPEKVMDNVQSFPPNNDGADNNSSLGRIQEATSNFTEDNNRTDSSAGALSFPLPPIVSSAHLNSPTKSNMTIQGPKMSVYPNASSPGKDVDTLSKGGKSGVLPSDAVQSDNISKTIVPAVTKKPDWSTEPVLSVSQMHDLLLQNRASSLSMKPRWSSSVEKDLLYAKSKIENAPIVENDLELYASVYRNISTFKRSYELMEQMLKVYIYREGAKPIFHTAVLKGIYASEGWFMKNLKANKQFVSKNPRKAHLFYLPFSSRLLEETLYVPNSHSHKNLVEFLKNYLDMIVARYNFWNRTDGADHFLVACHDWAPAETRRLMANCIRALCNSDVKEGFIFGKDVSLPETYVLVPRNPLRDLGGKRPSQRKVLAFFAGNMHGYLRSILLQHWENKDPDMKIFGPMHKMEGGMSYVQYMKSSKYCICAKGYEVNSPRVVEAIFYECVPVIISDNFVPPFFEILNWESFAVFIAEKDIPNLKNILLSIPMRRYLEMQRRVKKVQKHFLWHSRPEKYDIFHMILHSIWYNRVFRVNPR